MSIPTDTPTDGRALRWVQHRQERTQDFIEVTCAAVRQFGYQVSMDQIAEYANTSKSILYRYFPDKLSLQYEVGTFIVGNLVEQIKLAMCEYDLPADMVKAAIEVYLDFMENDLDLYIFMRIGDLEGEPGSSKMLDFDEIFLGTALGVKKSADEESSAVSDTRIVGSRIGSLALISIIRSVAEAWLFSRRILEKPEDYSGFTLDEGDRLVAQLSRGEITEYIFNCIEGQILTSFK